MTGDISESIPGRGVLAHSVCLFAEREAHLAAAGKVIALKSQKLGASVPLLAALAAKDPYRLKCGSSS